MSDGKISRFHEMKEIVPLALPVLVANISNMGMQCVDTIVAGRASGVDMAAVALGSSVFVPIQFFAAGILMVLGPIIANYRGRSVGNRSGFVTNNGLWLALLLSLFIVPLEYFAGSIFPLIAPDSVDMTRIASGYLCAILWGAPANLIFTALRSLNEGANMTRPAMFVALASLILNIPLNLLFVFGCGFIPSMGGAGCGVATACLYFFQAFAMFVLIYRHPAHRLYRRHIVAIRKPATDVLKHVFKVGFPVGMSVFCEVLLFCAASLVLAPQGYIQVGSHQVACTVAGMTYMIPMSVGLAVSIRVAYHLGNRNRAGVNSAILSSYTLVLSILFLSATTMVVFNREIAGLFNDEPDIVAVASFLLILGAVFQLPDCLQTVSVGVLRGFRDTAALGMITVVAYWVIGFPIGFILARTTWLTRSPLASTGIWVGFIFGLASAAILLLLRVRSTYRREFPSLSPADTK